MTVYYNLPKQMRCLRDRVQMVPTKPSTSVARPINECIYVRTVASKPAGSLVSFKSQPRPPHDESSFATCLQQSTPQVTLKLRYLLEAIHCVLPLLSPTSSSGQLKMPPTVSGQVQSAFSYRCITHWALASKDTLSIVTDESKAVQPEGAVSP